MNSAEKQRLIARISCKYIPVTIVKQDGNFISLLIRSPTPEEQAQSSMVYSVELCRANIVGLQSEEEVLKNLIILGQWSNQKELEIQGLQKDIHTIRRGLLDLLFSKTKLEQARTLLRRAEKTLIEKLSQKHLLLQTSAEAHAEICQQKCLISLITETEDKKPFWPTIDEFENCSDHKLIKRLCEEFFEKSRISINIIRELARSQQWRSYWEIAKNTNYLFDGPVVSWSFNQRELAYWSTIYDSVYGAFERPSRDIIDDDDLLDSWFIRQGEKIENKTQTNISPITNKPGKNETFIMADKEGAKRVYAMNDSTTRAQIKARQKLIDKQGKISEQHMPDSQRAIKQQLSEMQRKHIKSINHR